MNSDEKSFPWMRHPDAEKFVCSLLAHFVDAIPGLKNFESRLREETSTRLLDWTDHILIAQGKKTRQELLDLGFEEERVPVQPGGTVYVHKGTILPRIVLEDSTNAMADKPLSLALRVERVEHFLMAQGVHAPIEGSVLSPFRRAKIFDTGNAALLAVERRGYAGFLPAEKPADDAAKYLGALETWMTRPRRFENPMEGMNETKELAERLVEEVGRDTAAWIVFEAERIYWANRNRAGAVQKRRQDRVGLGWANQDHHTFRSSRKAFTLLIQILETLGFELREKFYAGAEAGWGAQVLEHPACQIMIFADVDLAAEELFMDHAHEPLPARKSLGTVGLWCALHGESMLEAGLHHLAARFDFDALTRDLADEQVRFLEPFSDFTHLKQAFTGGERWQVPDERLRLLVANGKIDEEQYRFFVQKAAVGSHMENIERNEGFKGFNQHSVSDIIRRTDPRADAGA
jgi:hypothetical protein